jgi:DNA repair protein RecO (recombination protein O)
MGKSAPQLYSLLCYYLKKIPQMANPWLLAASFRLKLLKHDGLARFPFKCSECGKCLDDEAFIYGSEGWCRAHHFEKSQTWDSIELQTVYHLANSQSFKEICLLDVQPKLQGKITVFFKACLQIEHSPSSKCYF